MVWDWALTPIIELNKQSEGADQMTMAEVTITWNKLATSFISFAENPT